MLKKHQKQIREYFHCKDISKMNGFKAMSPKYTMFAEVFENPFLLIFPFWGYIFLKNWLKSFAAASICSWSFYSLEFRGRT